jgi:hypothetical protein
LLYFQTMDAPQARFVAHIMDGYSFGKLAGIIKSEADYATLVFSPKTIEISFINKSKCGVHKIVLHAQELTQYMYNCLDPETGKPLAEYPIAVGTNDLYNTTKGIGRRDGIRLYLLEGDSKINIQPIKTSTKDPGRAGALFVPICPMEYVRYDVSGNYRNDPNVRVQAKDFADICSQANTLKCSSLEIVGQTSGVVFKGMRPDNTMASINRFVSQTTSMTNSSSNSTAPQYKDTLDNLMSNLKLENISSMAPTGITLDIIKSEDLLTVRVPIATVKALSKIHNISPTGTQLRFWFAEGKPTKIESPIGTYGTYIICLRNVRS